MASATAQPQTAQQQFNLECTGTTAIISAAAPQKTEPYSVTYRFDLARMKYCTGPCGTLEDIKDVQPTYIELHDETSDTPSGKTRWIDQIDRRTGEQHATYSSERYGRYGGMNMRATDAMCTLKPFTGFPAFETKF